jgi:outer membrane protein assembly factor BamB
MKLFPCRAALLALLMAANPAELAGAQTPPAATNFWSSIFPGSFDFSRSAPAVAPDGTIYTGTLLGYFMACTPDGQTKWTFKAGREIKSSPAIADDGTVYFGSRDRNFYAFTPAGKLKWMFATGAWVDSSPAIATDGTVYFGGWDKNFYALNPDGSLKWKFNAGSIVDSSPAIATDGTVYFGAHDGKLYALHPDGSVRWTFPTGGAIVSSPAIGLDGAIYFSSLDGNLYALNPDGTERWRCHTGSTTESSPVINAEGDLCIGNQDLTCIIDREGRKKWQCQAAVPVDVAAAAVTGRFYVSMPWLNVGAIVPGESPWDRRLWQAQLEGNATASLTVSEEGILYVCAGFHLYALRPPGDLLPPAKSRWPMFRGNPRHTGRAEK